MADRKKELKSNYKETPRKAGIVALLNIQDGSRTLMATPDINGVYGKFEFAKKTNSPSSLPMEFRNIVAKGDFDAYTLETVDTLDVEPGTDTKEVREDLAALMQLVQEESS